MRKQPQKTQEAAALKYSIEKDEAPVVIAVGRGNVAQKILEKAQEHDVPVVEDAGLAHVLSQINIGEQIPEELYTIVAQILIFVSDLDSQY